MGRRESASARIGASPVAVFSLVTDVAKLPEWNRAITDVVEVSGELAAGLVWKVRVHALGQSWVSKSRVSALDPTAGYFAYRSQSDDDNASYADWEWRVEPEEGGSMVTVTVDINPITFWRKHLFVRIRRPALRKEMQDSLAALGAAVQA